MIAKITLDSATLSKLNDLREPLEVCDAAGRTLGYFHPVVSQDNGAEQGAQSPFSREELEVFRRQRTGRPLSEILKQLERS